MTIAIQSQFNNISEPSLDKIQKPKRKIIRKKKTQPSKENQNQNQIQTNLLDLVKNEPIKKKRKIVKRKKIEGPKKILPMTPPSSIGSMSPEFNQKDRQPEFNQKDRQPQINSSTVNTTPPISPNTSLELELEENKDEENLDGKPKEKIGLLTKENLSQHTKSFKSVYEMDTECDDDDESDLEEVLVVNWKCASTNLYYLLDPITQEVYDKTNQNLIGIRYKSSDERSLIEFI